jgi:hypothetical protein
MQHSNFPTVDAVAVYSHEVFYIAACYDSLGHQGPLLSVSLGDFYESIGNFCPSTYKILISHRLISLLTNVN